jgi:hypothetical protein
MEREHLEGLGVDGRIILRWIEWDEEVRNGSLWLRTGAGTGGGCFRIRNELTGSIKCGEFLD